MTFLCGVLSTSNAKNEAINPDILCYALRFLIDIFLSLPPVYFFYSFFLLSPSPLPCPLSLTLPRPECPPPLPIPPSLRLSLLPCFTRLICSMAFTFSFVPLFLPIFLLHFSKLYFFLLSMVSSTLPYSSLPPPNWGPCHMHTLSQSFSRIGAPTLYCTHTPPLSAHFSALALSCAVSHMRSHLLFSFRASPVLLFFVSVAPFCCHPPSVCSFPLSPLLPPFPFSFWGLM